MPAPRTERSAPSGITLACMVAVLIAALALSSCSDVDPAATTTESPVPGYGTGAIAQSPATAKSIQAPTQELVKGDKSLGEVYGDMRPLVDSHELPWYLPERLPEGFAVASTAGSTYPAELYENPFVWGHDHGHSGAGYSVAYTDGDTWFAIVLNPMADLGNVPWVPMTLEPGTECLACDGLDTFIVKLAAPDGNELLVYGEQGAREAVLTVARDLAPLAPREGHPAH